MARTIKVKRLSEDTSSGVAKKLPVVLLVIVVLIFGFVVGKSFNGGSTKDLPARSNTPINEIKGEYAATKKVDIVPVGFDHSIEGATSAVSTYIGLAPRLYLANDSIFKKSVARMTTSSAEEAVSDQLNISRTAAKSIFAKDPNAFFREIPISYAIVNVGDESVTVNVWTVTMLVAKPSFNGNTEAKIHSIKVVWEDDDWKIDSWVLGAGPTPRWQSPTAAIKSVDEFLKEIEPFNKGYDYVPNN